ncbi:hypothetical protein [Paraclostridium bifermentans]|uniref:hypothetical protein n=1 Tax=Paraclostridium bifermentans TaxID=1490 RepID=UPI0025AFEBBC|nr:hypothetical protein [Paraclostridium bifermentans]
MKKYNLITYNKGFVVKKILFDSIEEVDNSVLEDIKNIDKIEFFKGKELKKEYKINEITLDETFYHRDTKILNYEIVQRHTGSIFFKINFEMSKELQKELELWHKKRFLKLRLIQSELDEAIPDVLGAAIV